VRKPDGGTFRCSEFRVNRVSAVASSLLPRGVRFFVEAIAAAGLVSRDGRHFIRTTVVIEPGRVALASASA
jgi:hypothetical protein